jgi:hypothetical protein
MGEFVADPYAKLLTANISATVALYNVFMHVLGSNKVP